MKGGGWNEGRKWETREKTDKEKVIGYSKTFLAISFKRGVCPMIMIKLNNSEMSIPFSLTLSPSYWRQHTSTHSHVSWYHWALPPRLYHVIQWWYCLCNITSSSDSDCVNKNGSAHTQLKMKTHTNRASLDSTAVHVRLCVRSDVWIACEEENAVKFILVSCYTFLYPKQSFAIRSSRCLCWQGIKPLPAPHKGRRRAR